ncbi:MAG: hypothetical protein KatS3mg013_1935 [Actinomycetota bacterium]|jgi:hypothetical protein|nr:MAG: hypothetical protein KatS3mg013_1935 [Actinomycetota bacterium]
MSGPLTQAERDVLAAIADRLVPPDGPMPAPSSIGIAEALADRVLTVRPDLREDLGRALRAYEARTEQDVVAWLQALGLSDPAAWRALTFVVVGGYYLHPEVRRALGYPGQQPEPVPTTDYPEYLRDGLLERVYQRGPRFRPAP